MPETPLLPDLFHPLIQKWFLEKFGAATDIQQQAWPPISTGRHVLITAPTGSGKTLTAFLWAINQIINGSWPTGVTSVLYVSPLKALNNDIQRNLSQPLAELKQVFAAHQGNFPEIRVATRSGDTSQSDRRLMVRHPPEILITTPESLNLLLSSKSGLSLLTVLKTVILDEIHSVVDGKRGVHLITAIDRLVPFSGEFQRIALSATVKPLNLVAEFIGGYELKGSSDSPSYTPRPVMTVQSETRKNPDLRVFSPEADLAGESADSIWDVLIPEFKKIILKNRSTLLFVNSRRLCETITFKLNQDEATPIAYSHHGSLSREIRDEVERKLKEGQLRAIVATSSLEMGIDIGALDEVILVQSPSSISSAIQRIGRAGHRVGQTSKAQLFPTHAFDSIQAAVLAAGIKKRDIEQTRPIICPLDVLSQIIISMTGTRTWDIDELYAILRTSYPYHNLMRDQYDLVLLMLAGRYADSRVRELKPRISLDKLDNTVAAKKGALLALYMAGGTIPDRGYFNLRHEDGARIGELDEEFVWEANVGKVFTIGTQHWRIKRITHNDVFVQPANPQFLDIPFWKSEEFNRSFHLSSRIADFLELADQRLDDSDYLADLQHEYQMNSIAASHLIGFLKRQREHTHSNLPHRHNLLLEYTRSGPGSSPGNQIVLHTLWGGQLNRPYAMALDAAWEDKYSQKLELFPSNDCIVLLLPHPIAVEELLSLVTTGNFESLLRKRLEHAGFFGARFRECAGRALLISKNKINERLPLWMNRLKSQKLLESIRRFDDFPILLETWRTCLQDEFDLENLRQVLAELASGVIGWSVANTDYPSPFTQGVSWDQINKFMYTEDQAITGAGSNLRDDLIRELINTPDLRPDIPPAVIAEFEQKRQRLFPGYSPQSATDILDWVKERVMIPKTEWKTLLAAIERDLETESAELVQETQKKLVVYQPVTAKEPLVISAELFPQIKANLFTEDRQEEFAGRIDESSAALLVGQWLQFYGPKSRTDIQQQLGLSNQLLTEVLNDLSETQTIVVGKLTQSGNNADICDTENLEILLRINRKRAIPDFDPLEPEKLQIFLARIQGIGNPAENEDDLFQHLERLHCLALPAEIWEGEILPARSHSYDQAWLDRIIQEEDLRWMGHSPNRITFCYEPDLDLLQDSNTTGIDPDPDEPQTPASGQIEELFPDEDARYTFSTLLRISNLNPSRLSGKLWDLVWQGVISNDSFSALRKGIENKFKVTDLDKHLTRPAGKGHRRIRRSGYSRWQGSVAYSGNWYRLLQPDFSEDLLEAEERKKDRVRILLDRYGIVFKALLWKEMPDFSWSNIFRSLRLMELSGEILSGYFFKDIPGPQFMSHQAFRILQSDFIRDSVYWINAADPASLCGCQIEFFRQRLPRRVATTHLVYRGIDLVLVSQRNGRILDIHRPPDDPDIQACFCSLRHLLHREFQPLKSITIETINGETAARSQYLDALAISFETLREPKKVVLYRKIN